MSEFAVTRAAAVSGQRSPPTKPRALRPTVWLTEVGGRSLVVKDYASSFWLYRWTLARIELAREQRAYERLAGLPFVPRFHGRLDRHALLLENVPARTMTAAQLDLQPKAMEQLYAAVSQMHGRGILHNDLRHRTNILIDDTGDVRLIDFASALDVARGWRRWLFGWLAFLDRSAVVKWWLRYFPDRVPPAEVAWYRRYLRWRALWPVRNPALKRQRLMVRQSPSGNGPEGR
jgi:hypothetical protein